MRYIYRGKADPAFRCTTVHRVTAYAPPCTADTHAQLQVQAYTHVSNPGAYILESNLGALGLLSYTLVSNTGMLDILILTLSVPMEMNEVAKYFIYLGFLLFLVNIYRGFCE